MTPISRGFGGRRRDDVGPSRLPPVTTTSVASRSCRPGRFRARRWEEWTFSIQGAGDEARSWTWDGFTALPAHDVTVDIHCVRRRSKLDTR